MSTSVIIATTCEHRRISQIRRAINSIVSQDGVPCELIVVVNGVRFFPPLLDELRADRRLTVHYREHGSFPAALRAGRERVSGKYFAFLDDDDMYLPGALRVRSDAIERDSDIDFVATNGYVDHGQDTCMFLRDVTQVERDPLGAAISFNWLGSSAALFRSSTVGPEFFDGVTKHFEWTWLTFQLLQAGKRSRFVNTPTFHKFDTPDSLSKDRSVEPLLTEATLLERMLSMASEDRRRLLRAKLRLTYHSISDHYLNRNQLRGAWKYHWKSVVAPGGWRHLAYTRHVAKQLIGSTPISMRVNSHDARSQAAGGQQ